MENHNKVTLPEAFAVQYDQLAAWKKKLLRPCYSALLLKCEVANEYVYDAEKVFRGYEIDNFVKAWKPQKK